MVYNKNKRKYKNILIEICLVIRDLIKIESPKTIKKYIYSDIILFVSLFILNNIL